MKITILSAALIMIFARSVFALDGSANSTRLGPDLLRITVYGLSRDISEHLSEGGVKFKLDPTTGSYVQQGENIRCIKEKKTDLQAMCDLSIDNQGATVR